VSDELELEVTAAPASVAKLRAAAVAFARAHGAEDEVRQAIALAVSEAATNAIVHGYRHDRDAGGATIRLSARTDRRGRLEITVADRGVGMSPRPDSPGMGVGLPLIAQLADEVKVLTDGGTAMVMLFSPTRDKVAGRRR
jgi:serine/threonine-protein kinase RsbW